MGRRLSVAALLIGLLAVLLPGAVTGGAGATDAARVGAPRPGAETAGDPLFPDHGNGGYDVRRYDVRLRWFPDSRRITARTTVRARARHGLSRLSLDLAGLRVSDVRVDGAPARWSRSGHKLRVVPRRAVPAGRVFSVLVAYRGRPRPITDPDGSTEGWMATPDGAIALNQPVGALSWYPNNDTPADKAAYDVRVRVPAGLEVASTGVLVSRRTAAGLTTWHWRTAQPTPPELSMLAIGQFRQHRARTSTGVPLHSFTDVRLGDAAQARRLMGEVLPWLERRLGPYPFDAAGIVVDGYSAGYALETQTRPVFPGSVDELTLVHELGHQWFGGSVTPRRWDDIWLNEGWATFVEWLWTEHTGGPSAARQLRAAYSSRGALDPFWDVPPAEPGSARELYHEAVYLRGAMALQVLRERIGEADFARLARRWVGDHRHGTVTTADLTSLAEAVSGEQLDALFEDWLRTPGRPSGY